MTEYPRLAAATLAACLTVSCGTSPPRDPEASAQRLAEINLQLGVAYMQEGNYPVALDRLRKAVSARPSSADAHLAIAVLYDRLGQDDAADIHFRQALQLEPSLAAAHTNYGSFLCKRGQVAEAEQEFLKAATDPGYANPEVAYTNAGLCLSRHGAAEKAEEYFGLALERNSQFAPALLAMADRAFATGRYAPAKGYLERHLNVAPPSAASLWLGVRIERQLGNRAGEATYAQLLTSRFPDTQEARQLRTAKGP
jgi:type IV pilus assembly protein PilF